MVFLSRTLSPSRLVWSSDSDKRTTSKHKVDHGRIDHSSVGQRDGIHRLKPTAVSRSPMQAHAQAVVINWWVCFNLPSYAKRRIRKLKSRRKWYRVYGPRHTKPWWSRILTRSWPALVSTKATQVEAEYIKREGKCSTSRACLPGLCGIVECIPRSW